MKTLIKNKNTFSKLDNLIILCDHISLLKMLNLSKEEIKFIQKEWRNKESIICINQYKRYIYS